MAVLFAALPAAAGTAGPARSPDEIFEKKLYQEALDGYEALANKAASGDALWRARYRIVECRTLFFRYGEALRYVEDAGLPQDPLWKGRWLILKMEMYREFVKQYGRGARGDAVEGGEDPVRKTPKELHAAARAGFEAARLEHQLDEPAAAPSVTILAPREGAEVAGEVGISVKVED